MRTPIAAIAVGAALVLGACSGGSGSGGADGPGASDAAATNASNGAQPAVLARPVALAGLPEVELLAPGETEAGPAPTFEWNAVDGAAAYRLSVVGPDRPLWSWVGEETRVTLALRTDDRSEQAPGLEIEQGSWWSVAALAADGSVLALSPFRAVSPEQGPAEPTPPPFLDGTPLAAGDTADDGADGADEAPEAPEAPASSDSGELPDACDIVTPEEVAQVFGDVADYGPSGFPTGEGSDCVFERVNDGLTIDIQLDPTTAGYRPEDWVSGEPTPVDGLGDESYIVNDGLSIKIAWIHGASSAHVWAYAGSEQAVIDLAKLVDSRLP